MFIHERESEDPHAGQVELYGRVTAVRPKSIRVKVGAVEAWLPRSKVSYELLAGRVVGDATVWLPPWLARRVGFV